ncbi:MAG: DUF4198 domain-containing protein [Synergistaceae bacterium]|jgi:uncharacterized GH25 family protein|nr:DUF4198 domain-containing protein [Synergistaceae bacterium]
MRKTIFAAMAIIAMFSCPVSAHELIIKPGAPKAENGAELAVELQSTHIFIVKEEVEDVSKIKAGIANGSSLIESRLSPNEPELRIDFSVKIQNEGSSIIFAKKEGEIWSVTNEGSKPGPRKALEDQGFKVARSTLNDKYAKAFVNISEDDKNFEAVLGQDLEIVPVTNPAAAKTGEYFRVKILHKGQPIAIPVLATYDGFCTEFQNTYAYYTESNAEGVANIKITAPGLWIIRTSKDGDPGVEGEYDTRSLRSTMTFTVEQTER